MDIDLCIDLVCDACLAWAPVPPLTQEQRDVFKAMLAFGNIYLLAQEYADDGDFDALASIGEITGIRPRV